MAQTRPTDTPVIAVAGAASVDMTLRDPPRDWIGDVGRDVYTPATLQRLEAPPEAGLGGNGAAAAYVLGKLGLRVLLNAPISNDPTGQLIRSWLDQAGVECVAPPGRSNMVSITAVDDQGRRLGTLQHVGPDVDWALSAQPSEANWLLLALHARIGDAEFPRIGDTLRTCHKRGQVTVLDSGIGWIPRLEPPLVHGLWADVELLVGTIEELGHWTGQSDPQAIAAFVLGKGPRQVVVKMGAAGAACQSSACPFEHQRACPVSRSDVSIGAGDSFNGALVAALAGGAPLPDAVARAQRVAAQVVDTGRGVLGWGQTATLQE